MLVRREMPNPSMVLCRHSAGYGENRLTRPTEKRLSFRRKPESRLLNWMPASAGITAKRPKLRRVVRALRRLYVGWGEARCAEPQQALFALGFATLTPTYAS